MATPDRDPRGFLPLTPAVFHVLAALADGEMHGYGVIKDVATRTDGAVELGTGTLYGIIKRLLADGFVIESKHRPAADEDDARRKYYRLTNFGRRVAIAETNALKRC